jgi:BirA family biotin operon repressor/biotin-[acetyl-CoA-carboxylase] ligase
MAELMSISKLRAEDLKRLISYYHNHEAFINTDLDAKTKEKILRRARIIGHEVYYYKKVDRLMSLARKAIIKADVDGTDFPSGCVWWADSLVKARGRIGRRWWAPEGGIYLCIAMYPSLLSENWSFYNLGIGVAIAQVLKEKGFEAKIRWINDILINGCKVAGIYTELFRTGNSGQMYLLFGIGINVNIKNFPPELAFATSLSIATGKNWNIKGLAAQILAKIGWMFGLVEQWESGCLNSDFFNVPQNPIIKAWNILSDTPGSRVIYGLDAELKPELEALAQGLAPDGSLKLILDDAEEIKVNSGEIRYIFKPDLSNKPR